MVAIRERELTLFVGVFRLVLTLARIHRRPLDKTCPPAEVALTRLDSAIDMRSALEAPEVASYEGESASGALVESRARDV